MQSTRLLPLVLAFAVCVGAHAEPVQPALELQLSFSKGPETHIAFPIPNVQLNWFPIPGSAFYLGTSANVHVIPMHLAVVTGYSLGPGGLEVSVAGSYYANPFSYSGEHEETVSLNPKLCVQIDNTDLGFGEEKAWNVFGKLGPGLTLWKRSNVTERPIVLWNPELLGVPFNVEVGFGWLF